MNHRRSIVLVVLALLASCGDNLTPPAAGKPTAVQTNVSGAMDARSTNYRVVSTVTSGGELRASSGAHAVTSSVRSQGGGQ